MLSRLLVTVIMLTAAFTRRFLASSFVPSIGGRLWQHCHFASVTGIVYTANEDAPHICLFTKEGCTLCDKAKDVLNEIRNDIPHSLEQIDITDGNIDAIDSWYDKYKYDIPVLHVNGKYWTKHRLSVEQAVTDLEKVNAGTFVSNIRDEPHAGALERRQAERSQEK